MEDGDLFSTLLRLKSTSTSATDNGENSCFSTAIETVWAKAPEVAGELLEELTRQAEKRQLEAPEGQGAGADTSSQKHMPAYDANAKVIYVCAATQTSTAPEDATMPRSRRRRPGDSSYRPSHPTSNAACSRPLRIQQESTSKNGLPPPKSPDTPCKSPLKDSEGYQTPAETESSPFPSTLGCTAPKQNVPTRTPSPSPLDLVQYRYEPVDRILLDDTQERGNAVGPLLVAWDPETIPGTPQEVGREISSPLQDKFNPLTSLAPATCLSLVSQETARQMIFTAARDIYDMESNEESHGDKLHRGILEYLKSDLASEVSSQPAVLTLAASHSTGWSLTMWMNVLDRGNALHKKSGMMRKIEWMGASAWFDCQVENSLKAPQRTKRGMPMKRVSSVVLDRMIDEARDESSHTSSKVPIDRKTQQRKTFIDLVNKGKRLRQIVKALGMGILFHRHVWKLIKVAQHQVEAVVSHLSTDPQKAATLTLLGDQVDLLAKDGSPNSAAFLDAVEAKALVSADDVFSLRSNFGSSTSDTELVQHIDYFKNSIHQALGKRDLCREDTITLSGKSIPGDSLTRLGTGEWFDTWLLEAALEIQDRPASIKLGLCVCMHEIVEGNIRPVQAPFRRWKDQVDFLRASGGAQRSRDACGFIFLCPLVINTNHFTLLEINESERMIYHYDSLVNRAGKAGLSQAKCVQSTVEKEFKHLSFGYSDAPTPQQQDTSSCGPMVVRNASRRMNRQPVGDWNDRVDPTHLRATIAQDFYARVSCYGVDPDPRRSKRLRCA